MLYQIDLNSMEQLETLTIQEDQEPPALKKISLVFVKVLQGHQKNQQEDVLNN